MGLATVFAFTPLGCGPSHPRITVIPKTTATDYWENMHDGVVEGFRGTGAEVRWIAPPAEADFIDQSNMVEAAIAAHVDGIILAPSHPAVLASSIRHAASEGIPVVLVDSVAMVSPSDYQAHIASDQHSLGVLAARAVEEACPPQSEVLVLADSPTLTDDAERIRGFSSQLASSRGSRVIQSVQYALADPLHAKQLTLDALERDPAITAVFASEAFATRGALAAVEQRGEAKVKIIGIAQERDLLDMVRSGRIAALVVQEPHRIGLLAARAVLRRNPMNRTTGENVVTSATTVTNRNIDAVEMRPYLGTYTDLDAKALNIRVKAR